MNNPSPGGEGGVVVSLFSLNNCLCSLVELVLFCHMGRGQLKGRPSTTMTAVFVKTIWFAGGVQSRGLRKPWLWSLLFQVFPIKGPPTTDRHYEPWNNFSIWKYSQSWNSSNQIATTSNANFQNKNKQTIEKPVGWRWAFKEEVSRYFSQPSKH